jgi:hypothetical protein
MKDGFKAPLLQELAGRAVGQELKWFLFAAFALACCCLSVSAQQVRSEYDDVQLLTKPIPHPYLYFGPSLMGGGYATFAARGEAGIDLESTHLLLGASAGYDNGHKVNDADQPNPKGHDRYLQSNLYWRWSNRWFLGAGWQWSQLSTSNYTKGGSRPSFGGGFDYFMRSCENCRRDFSMRLKVDYVLPGTDWQNGSQGPNIVLTFPAPSEKRHWFYQEGLGIYGFHSTVSDPKNIPLLRFQLAHRSFTSYADFGVLYRF